MDHAEFQTRGPSRFLLPFTCIIVRGCHYRKDNHMISNFDVFLQLKDIYKSHTTFREDGIFGGET